MFLSAARSESPRRHPWPRVLVRLRRAWHDVLELASFLGAVVVAVARFLIGRWPEPAGQDYLAPTGEPLRRAGSSTSRKAGRRPRALVTKVSNGGLP